MYLVEVAIETEGEPVAGDNYLAVSPARFWTTEGGVRPTDVLLVDEFQVGG
jgi:hypothetical protein